MNSAEAAEHPASARDPFTGFTNVEGYCWPQSYQAGDQVELRCSSRVDRFAVEVARVGASRVIVWQAADVVAPNLHSQPNTHDADCDWPIAVIVPTEVAWPSAFYHVRFITDTDVSDTFFVIRPHPDRSTGPNRALLVLSTNTWNAYNQWGGRCLYSGATKVSFARPLERGYLHRHADPDGFDGRVANIAEPSDPEHTRLQQYQAAGPWPLWTGSSGWHNWERRFVVWAEQRGFEIDIAVNADLAFHAEVLDKHPLLLSVGHDEYWSLGMRDRVDRFVEDGGNWAIFSGNTMFWQVRYEDEGRSMVCYKGSARRDDPMHAEQPAQLTSIWSDPIIGRPETLSTGLTFTRGGYYRMGKAISDGSGTYSVIDAGHWALAGTGLATGDEIGTGSFVVAYEVDGCALDWSSGQPRPTGEDGAPTDMDIIATAPARLISITDDVCEAPEPLWADVEPPGDLEAIAATLFGSVDDKDRLSGNRAVMASFRRDQGSVFNVGTTDWAYGLNTKPGNTKPGNTRPGNTRPDADHRSDTAVDRITSNVLRRFLG